MSRSIIIIRHIQSAVFEIIFFSILFKVPKVPKGSQGFPRGSLDTFFENYWSLILSEIIFFMPYYIASI